MGFMKNEDIKALNEMGFTTPELEVWAISMSLASPRLDAIGMANEIIDRLRRCEELEIRIKFAEKKYEALYTRLQEFVNKTINTLDSPK